MIHLQSFGPFLVPMCGVPFLSGLFSVSYWFLLGLFLVPFWPNFNHFHVISVHLKSICDTCQSILSFFVYFVFLFQCISVPFSTQFIGSIFSSFSAKAKTIFEDVKKIIFQIERAIRHKKIFCLGGCFPSARKALIKRGWVEVASRSRSVKK